MKTSETRPLPPLKEIAPDLLKVSRSQVFWALARPWIVCAAFFAAGFLGWWWLTPFIVAYLFVCVIFTTHELVHHTLPLSPPQTERALFAYGAILLQSGHAFRYTHHYHHRHFPHSNDPESLPAFLAWWKNLLIGPVYLPMLFLFAWKKMKHRPDQRRWMVAEGLFPPVMLTLALLASSYTLVPLIYIAAVAGTAWLYPLITVWIQHDHHGSDELHHSRTLRGKWLNLVFLGLPMHLEHHLYPTVPGANLHLLAGRLDPWLKENGVRVPKVI